MTKLYEEPCPNNLGLGLALQVDPSYLGYSYKTCYTLLLSQGKRCRAARQPPTQRAASFSSCPASPYLSSETRGCPRCCLGLSRPGFKACAPILQDTRHHSEDAESSATASHSGKRMRALLRSYLHNCPSVGSELMNATTPLAEMMPNYMAK